MSAQDIFSENVRKFRKAKGLTQEGLGETAGLHRTYIGGIEQRRINPSLKNIESIAKALDVEPAFLLIANGADVIRNDLDHAFTEGVQQTGSSASRSAYSNSSEDHYALCLWNENEITFLPFDIDNATISARTIALFRQRGLTGSDLAKATLLAQEDFRTYLRNL